MLGPRFHPALRAIALALLGCLLSAVHADAIAAESVRDQEISECRNGEIATWEDGRDRPALNSSLTFAYNHAGAPAWFPQASVMDLLAKAAAAWSQCGIQARAIAWNSNQQSIAGLVLVQWNDQDSGGNFGLANMGLATLSLGTKAFELLKARNPTYDASIVLQMTISHEMGHLFGLMAHSRRCVDVLSYYHNDRGEKCFARDFSYAAKGVDYRASLPTACDIARCRIANRLRPAPPIRPSPAVQPRSP